MNLRAISEDSRPASPRQSEGGTASLAVGTMAILAGSKLLLHVFLADRYGYFRDELYFLDCGRHLAWGYVDHAPMIGLVARLALLLGGSLHALRIFPAVAGALLVALATLMTWRLGGGRYAQAVAGLCILFAPEYLGGDSILTMNCFEPLFWMGCIYIVIRIVQTGNSRLWIWFGVLSGLGLMNKHSTLFFGLAVVIALMLTPLRREFLKPWIWIAGGIALLIFLPNLLWQTWNHFPTLEDLHNVAASGKNVILGPGAFLVQQIMMIHPVLFLVWAAGLAYLFVGRAGNYRFISWTYLTLLTIFILLHGKDYYLAPAYPMLFAGGAVAVELWLESGWARAAVVAVIVAAGGMVAPLALPLLSPENYIAYEHFLHVVPAKTEVNHDGPLPQLWGDQFGWPELVTQVAQIYNALPPEERSKAAILTGNYGEAGAIDQLGPAYGLPQAISGHQTHSMWGPMGYDGQVIIFLQYSRRFMESHCTSYEEAAVHSHPWGMQEENRPIYVCRGLKPALPEMWPELKHWN